MQLERMFFIWTLPHTSAPVDPGPSGVSPQCHPVYSHDLLFFFLSLKQITESHSMKADKQYCNIALPELASLSMCDGFCAVITV